MARRNGFQRPWHLLQLLSWFIFSACVVGWPLFFAVAFSSAVAVWLSCIYGVLLVSVIYTTTKATGTDPIDPSCVSHDAEEPWQREKRKSVRIAGRVWCPYCSEHVQARSKHCRSCDKCVSTFDHHCKWLNTCIGQANYRWFLGCISSVFLLVGLQAATALYLLVASTSTSSGSGSSGGSDWEETRQRLERLWPGMDAVALRAIMGTYLGVMSPLLASLVHLLGLHLYLNCRKMTTYEWIIEQRQTAQLQRQKQAELARARMRPAAGDSPAAPPARVSLQVQAWAESESGDPVRERESTGRAVQINARVSLAAAAAAADGDSPSPVQAQRQGRRHSHSLSSSARSASLQAGQEADSARAAAAAPAPALAGTRAVETPPALQQAPAGATATASPSAGAALPVPVPVQQLGSPHLAGEAKLAHSGAGAAAAGTADTDPALPQPELSRPGRDQQSVRVARPAASLPPIRRAPHPGHGAISAANTGGGAVGGPSASVNLQLNLLSSVPVTLNLSLSDPHAAAAGAGAGAGAGSAPGPRVSPSHASVTVSIPWQGPAAPARLMHVVDPQATHPSHSHSHSRRHGHGGRSRTVPSHHSPGGGSSRTSAGQPHSRSGPLPFVAALLRPGTLRPAGAGPAA